MKINDFGASTELDESVGNEVALYMIRELAKKIMHLNQLYAQFKKMGNTSDAEKIKHKIATLSAEKREMEAAAGMDTVEETGIGTGRLAAYMPAANKWRDDQGVWPEDEKIRDKAGRRAEYTLRAGNELLARQIANKEKENAQQNVRESGDIDSQIEMLQTALQKARASTKAIKHDDTVNSIIVELQQIAREVGISEKEFNYEINAVFEAKNALESAVYSLEDIFADKLRKLEWQKEESEVNGDINEAKGLDNFTADDLTALSAIADLDAMKAKAKELIATPSKRPMKPEKVEWFNSAIDKQQNKNSVIKLMYDLLLSGEGNSVLGTRYSMSSNSYRKRFGESSEAISEDDPCWDDYKQIGMKTKNGKQVPNCVPKESVEEGMMGGINRAAPAQDVSYEKILNDVTDTWRGQKTTVTELDKGKLKKHTDDVKSLDPLTTPKYKLVKHIEGGKRAGEKLARKTGDRTSSSYPVKTYEERLNKFLKD